MQTYEEYLAEYQSTPDDLPDRRDFYARFYAMNKLVEQFGLNPKDLNGFIHNTVCMTDGSKTLQGLIAGMEFHIDRLGKPEERPHKYYSSDYEPEFDQDKEAYELFKHDFKARFKEHKINSKFAKQKWQEVSEKARQIAKDRFKEKHDAWQSREKARDTEYQRIYAKWAEREEGRKTLVAFVDWCKKQVGEPAHV